VRLLLDTHALIWAAEGTLAGPARATLDAGTASVYVSAATVWEIEIKRALGRLRVPGDVPELVDRSGFERLSITFEHARAAGQLDRHHGDPFDRMLVAQAQLEAMTLATADHTLRRYGVSVVEASSR
jgi:PIN domain nuclease of toxin-antitoxin system